MIIPKSFVAIIFIGVFACKQSTKPLVLQEDRPFIVTSKDSVLIVNGHWIFHEIIPGNSTSLDSNRYFYINYVTQPTNTNADRLIHGCFGLVSSSFPSKVLIDKHAYEYMYMKRNCYQGIIITNIMEFKNAKDYNDFWEGYKGDPIPTKHINCE